MTRNLKVAFSALLALMAFGAMAAQASANDTVDLTDNESAVLTGEQEGLHKFSVGGVTVQCTTATFAGTVKEEAEITSVHPEYAGCTLSGAESIGLTVDTEGCTYDFYSETTDNGSGKTDAPVDITCDAEEGSGDIRLTGACELRVPAEQGKTHGVSYKNLTEHGPNKDKDAVTVTATVAGLEATSTGGLGCFLVGLGNKQKTYTTASYVGNTEVTGYIDEDNLGTPDVFEHGALADFRINTAPDA